MDLNMLGRVPPQSIEAEQAVIGSLVLDKEVIDGVLSKLDAKDFYREDHKEIFETIKEMHGSGEVIDIITVSEQLKRRGTLGNVGGLEYITNMASSVPTTANVKHYAKIVKEKAALRSLLRASSLVIDRTYENVDEVNNLIQEAVSIIQNIDTYEEEKVKPFREVIAAAFETLERRVQDGDSKLLKTFYEDLDRKLIGMESGDLVLVAARPAMGKTSFVLNIGQNVAQKKKIPVAVFSLEMSQEQLTNRILSSECLIDLEKFRTGLLEDDDWRKLARALGYIPDMPLFIDDRPGLSIDDIKHRCQEIKKEHGLGLVVVDYLQLLRGTKGRYDNRNQEVSDISRSAKIMAKELGVPVIMLSQLSRAPEQRADHRPILADLRESGSIEQDADIVMFLYRDDYYNPDSEKKNIAEVIIAKHRNGSTGTVELAWLGQYTKFANLCRTAPSSTRPGNYRRQEAGEREEDDNE